MIPKWIVEQITSLNPEDQNNYLWRKCITDGRHCYVAHILEIDTDYFLGIEQYKSIDEYRYS